MMKYPEAAIIGIVAYMLYCNCNYDLVKENSSDKDTGGGTGRISYLFRMDRKRCGQFMLFLISALAAVVLLGFYGYGPLKIARYYLLLGLLYPIARQDAKEKQIPNRWLVYLLVLRSLIFIMESACYPELITDNLLFTLAGGLICGGLMFIICVLSRHAIGMGDVKLFGIIGLFLGASVTYVTMFVASVLSAIYGLWRIAIKKIGVKDEIAFAPFIAVSVLIVIGMGF